MYKKDYIVKLPDTDAAGILFFASYIKLAHEIYESFMIDIGFSLRHIIEESDYLILIAHCESDYKKSLRLEDSYEITVSVSKIGGSSFGLKYVFANQNDVIAEVATVHVVVDKQSKKPIKMTDELRGKLEEFRA